MELCLQQWAVPARMLSELSKYGEVSSLAEIVYTISIVYTICLYHFEETVQTVMSQYMT